MGHSIGSPRGVRTAAVIVAAARYAKVLDWAGPNLASNQVVIYAPNGGQSHGSWDLPQGRLRSMAKTVDAIGSASGAQRLLHLETARASLNHAAPDATGRDRYDGTPSQLGAFGITAPEIDLDAGLPLASQIA